MADTPDTIRQQVRETMRRQDDAGLTAALMRDMLNRLNREFANDNRLPGPPPAAA